MYRSCVDDRPRGQSCKWDGPRPLVQLEDDKSLPEYERLGEFITRARTLKL